MRIAALLCVLSSAASATDVLTQHNDIGRTGAVLDETVLSPRSVREQHFGKLFSLPVDGQIYAQPLIVTGLDMPAKGVRNVVVIATMRNMVYAYDAEGGRDPLFWSLSLGDPMPYDRIPQDAGALLGQYNIRPYIGVTSTPVIDRAQGVLYVVAKIAQHGCPGFLGVSPDCPVIQRIHAIQLTTGKVLQQTDIRIPMQNSSVPADDVARRHLQRPGLLLANGRVYAAFGAHQDAPPYQGWVIAFDAATLRQIDPVFCTTPAGEMGGIWQAGNGLAADPHGNLYFMTGNGSYDPSAHQYGSSLIKLDQDLNPAGWFAPANVEALNLLDVDLGSSGPMLLPGTDELVGGGKEGKFYVVNLSKPGGREQHHWLHDELNPPVQYFRAARRWRITWLSWLPFLFNVGYHHIHGGPVYWNSRLKGPTIYVWPEEDNVKAFHYDPAKKFNKSPLKGMMGNRGMPGGFLSISANGTDDGILWGAIPYQDDAWVEIVRGTLRAFDANTLELLWSTDRDEPWDHFDFAKYVSPTVANGKVYLPTFSDRLNVYGLHASPPPAPPPTAKLSRDPRHRGHIKGASGHTGHH